MDALLNEILMTIMIYQSKKSPSKFHILNQAGHLAMASKYSKKISKAFALHRVVATSSSMIGVAGNAASRDERLSAMAILAA